MSLTGTRTGRAWRAVLIAVALVVSARGEAVAAISLSPWQTLTGVWESDAAWGDFDGDGDLDLATCGQSDAGRVTRTYENQAGTLVLRQSLTGIQGEGSGCLAWGDYDSDGDLDLAMAGMSDGGRIARIYRNDGAGNLTWDESQILTGVALASVAWGDYDNDGDLDLLVKGHDGALAKTTLYRNQPLGQLTVATGTSLVGLYSGSADWADWDGDGDLDLLITGSDGSARQTIFYKNQPVGTLTSDGAHGLPAVALSDAVWGDVDNDGDLDLAFTGDGGASGYQVKVYRNGGTGVLTSVPFTASLPVYRSSCALGDNDNDGDLDLVVCGYDGMSASTYLYDNQGTQFGIQPISLVGVREGSLSWADVDRDGDLDLLVTGADFDFKYATLYRNSGGTANSAPSAPTVLTGSSTTAGLQLTWSGASDAQTPGAGLYYCLRVGTSPGAGDIVSGTYATPLMGNVGEATRLKLNLPVRPYYFSVRAIDSGLLASAWAPEQRVLMSLPAISSIRDVGGDQGRYVRLQWYRSFYDAPADSVAITGYSVWRRVDRLLAGSAAAEALRPGAPVRICYPPGDWDYVTTVPARGELLYSYVAPTLCDSNATGMCRSVFFVSAMTPDPLLYYDSAPDSGYSVDNLPPAAPAPFTAAYTGSATALHWGESGEADFWVYRLYRGSSADFVPGPSNLIVTRSDTGYVDPGPAGSYYKLSAVDVNGNEGSFALITPATTLDVPGRGPHGLTLAAVHPNPARGDRLTVEFVLAREGPAALELLDVTGRRIARRELASPGVGSQAVELVRGARLAPGLYLVRLTQGHDTRVRRVIVLD
jgi:hypothetical protein